MMLLCFQSLAMNSFFWASPVRTLPGLSSCKLVCSFCGGPAPVSVRPDVDPTFEQTSYLLQISEAVSVHRNCLTAASDLPILPGEAELVSRLSRSLSLLIANGHSPGLKLNLLGSWVLLTAKVRLISRTALCTCYWNILMTSYALKTCILGSAYQQ